MRSKVGLVVVAGVAASMLIVQTAAHAADESSGVSHREMASAGTVLYTGGASGIDGLSSPEIREQEADGGAQPFDGVIVNRQHGDGGGSGGGSGSGHRSDGDVRLKQSFDGLNHRQQRLANGGNQFSLEPPDQGLCVGNGSVMEVVNTVTRVYDTSGNPRSPVVDLNTFLGYLPAVQRTATPMIFGPVVTDPSCFFDAPTQRWFLDVLTLDADPQTGDLTGSDHLDLAVSSTPDPTGSWTIYRLPVQDDGTQGTPNHACSEGPCIGDYPHLGADGNGIYLTTNEYSLLGPEFHGAQIYAMSKAALVAGRRNVDVVQYDTHGLDTGNSGFTLWPATSPAGDSSREAGGTEYLLSSNAADEAHGDGTAPGPRQSRQLLVWALTNTSALDARGIPGLSHTVVPVRRYGTPPPSDQKAGDQPLRECLNDVSCATVLVGGPDPYGTEEQSTIDSNDTRMQQVTYANGKLWGAVDTALTIHGVNKAGIEWFVIDPSIRHGGVTAQVRQQHYLGLADNNLIWPAIGVNSKGQGVMTFTVVGSDYFPSAGYVELDATAGSSDIRIAADGLGPDDGFSAYKPFNADGIPRPRWGDYGATAVDGNSIWIASEYIGQTCTLAEYEQAPFGSCDGTRTALANWDTRVSHLKFSPADVHWATGVQS